MKPAVSAVQVKGLHLFPCLTHGHTGALDQLGTAYSEAQPVAILVGEDKSSASYLVDRFIHSIGSGVAIGRITTPCRDANAGMRAVTKAVGLEPEDRSLAGLESALVAFLWDQKRQARRTIICFEQAQDTASRVLHTVRRLVELETKDEFGLMVILSGPPDLSEVLMKPAFNLIRAHAGARLVPGPFTLAETKAYVSREAAAAGFADISQIFELAALTLIHEVCAGVIDRIDDICCRCIKMQNKLGVRPISTNMVIEADKQLRQKRLAQHTFNGARFPGGRLIARKNGVVVQEHALNQGHMLIGRGKLCDITVESPVVSRNHALVVDSPDGVGLVDLGSKNGTYVDGHRIEQRVLQNGDLITVGDCTITYFAGSR